MIGKNIIAKIVQINIKIIQGHPEMSSLNGQTRPVLL